MIAPDLRPELAAVVAALVGGRAANCQRPRAALRGSALDRYVRARARRALVIFDRGEGLEP